MFKEKASPNLKDDPSALKLKNGSRIAVIGGGPAGSFFSFFALDLAGKVGLDIQVDIYEQQDFSRCGPAGCNHCAGTLSESMVQILGMEGIKIPSNVIQRGIESYLLHMNVGSVRIKTPVHEKRIATMFRGAGPLKAKDINWESFDGYLQGLAVKRGASIVRERVDNIDFSANLPLVTSRSGLSKSYDLVVGAVGVNTPALKLFEKLGFGYQPPQLTKTFICEYHLGNEMVKRYFGNTIHIFLLNIPRLKFAAIIPKGEYVTLCLIGEGVDKELVNSFLETSEVKKCFPYDWDLFKERPCQCFPKINIQGVAKPFTDRLVMIGDCAVTRLYKDGIGAAYYTAKAAATASVFQGISYKDFYEHYLPTCKSISKDNAIGKIIFNFTRLIQKRDFSKRGLLRMIVKEQREGNKQKRLSTVLWDVFTGSAPYRDIFQRTLNFSFIFTLIREMVAGFLPFKVIKEIKEDVMETGTLGKTYKDNEIIIKQGEMGDCMYIIQSGKVVVTQLKEENEVRLAELSEGDFFGEMALFTREQRSATVRAKGEAAVLTVDKKTLLGRIQKDPSLAFGVIQQMSSHICKLNTRYSRINVADRRDWDARPDEFSGKSIK